jgi:hypothetical protein
MTPNEIWTDELNKAFSKEEVQMAKTQKKCSPSLAIKEMQIKTTLRFYSCWNSYHQEHKQQQQLLGEDVGKKEPSHTAGRNVS